MPPARHPKQPKLQATKRTAIDATLHSKFDSALKDLRTCSRQLSSIHSCLEDELRILDRLYYKGVNQHRSALFWHKVEEIRRLGKRLLEVQLLNLTDSLRYSFYIDSDTERNPKILRNAWTQVPDFKYVSYALERTQSSLLLANKARERFASAHHTFTLMLQTGAFLQFILVLTALVSRLDVLVSELQTLLQKLDATVTNLIEALGGKVWKSRACSKKALQRPPPPLLAHPEAQGPMTSDEFHGEDIGSTVIRKGPDAEEPETTSQRTQTDASLFWQQDAQSKEADLPDQHAASAKPILIVTTTVKRRPQDTNQDSESAADGEQLPTRKKKVKKQKKRDEIDDIFGSL